MNIRCSACGVINPGPVDHGWVETGKGSRDLMYCSVRNQPCVSELISEDGRLDRDELFMRTAMLFAKRGTCPRAQVGAVIVKDKRIVSSGYNGAPPGADHCFEVGCVEGPDGGCIRTTHAELNAIVWAARSGISVENSTMYCTYGPCLTCAKAIATAGIRRVVFLNPYRAMGDAVRLLDQLFILVEKLELEDEPVRSQA